MATDQLAQTRRRYLQTSVKLVLILIGITLSVPSLLYLYAQWRICCWEPDGTDLRELVRRQTGYRVPTSSRTLYFANHWGRVPPEEESILLKDQRPRSVCLIETLPAGQLKELKARLEQTKSRIRGTCRFQRSAIPPGEGCDVFLDNHSARNAYSMNLELKDFMFLCSGRGGTTVQIDSKKSTVLFEIFFYAR